MAVEDSTQTSKRLRPGEGEALLLAVPPLAVFGVSQWLFESAGFDIVALGYQMVEVVRDMPSVPAAVGLAGLETRLLWALAAFINLAAAVALTSVAVIILVRSVSMRGLRLFVPIGFVLIALGIGSYFYAMHAETPIAGIFSFTFDTLAASGALDPTFLLVVKFVVVLLNLMTMVAPMSAMMAACSTLAPPRDGGPGDVAFLGGQVRSLKALVVLGSTYMVAGILHLGVWLAWPSNLIAGDPDAVQIIGFAKAVTIYWGGCFTVLIAAFYAPAMIVLRQRAQAVIARSPEDTGGLTPEKFLEDHGLSLSLAKQLPQIGAVLAPLIAGPIGTAGGQPRQGNAGGRLSPLGSSAFTAAYPGG